MSSHTSLAQDLSLVTTISIVTHVRTSLSRLSLSTSTCPSLSSSFPSTLRYSANKGSDDAYDVSISLTGYEPNFVTFGELNDSSGSFSYIIPSSDQDMDDVTLGKLLTEAHRGQADYCEPEGVSVSQSSSSVVFDASGKPDGERNVVQSIGFGATRNTYSAHSKFSENTQAEKMVNGSGNLMSEIARAHRLGLYLKNRDRRLSRNIAIKSVVTNSMQLTQKKSAYSYKDNYGDRNWNFMKFINKVLQRWRNYENSRVLPSIRSQDESLSRTRTLFWNYQAEYRNCKMKQIV